MTADVSESILLVESNFTGHRLAYIRLLAEEALRRSMRVHIALPIHATSSAEFELHLGHLVGLVEVQALNKFNLVTIEHHSKAVKAQRTIVTDGDSLALELFITGRWRGFGRLSTLIMRECAQPHKNHLLRLGRTVAKKIVQTRVASSRGVDMAVLKSALWDGKSRYRVAIDPVHVQCTEVDIERLRRDWRLDESVYWFAVLGSITERKNVPLVADALSRVPEGKLGLMIAGKIDPAIKAQIEASVAQLGRLGWEIRIVDKLLNDLDLDAAVSATDCLVLAHSNEGPSGLLGKAAAVGTNVVAAGAESLRRDTQVMGSSALWSPLLVTPMSESLTSVLKCRRESLRTSRRNNSSFLNVLLPYD